MTTRWRVGTCPRALRDQEPRQVLEPGWSSQTRHPDFVAPYPHRRSSGQCGVSSVWQLVTYARLTMSMRRIAMGPEVSTTQPSKAWQGIAGSKVVDETGETIIVDLTADQAIGFGQKAIIGPARELAARGIRYKSRTRKHLDESTANPLASPPPPADQIDQRK